MISINFIKNFTISKFKCDIMFQSITNGSNGTGQFPQQLITLSINQEELSSVEDNKKPKKCEEKKKELAKYGGKKTRKTMHR